MEQPMTEQSLPLEQPLNLPLPSQRQLDWHRLELYGFLHFTVNTFTGLEWGYGDEAPAIFNPTDFDADQMVETAQAGGLKGLILTCKHHDGFCLWPSAYTEHSVKNSPWRKGQGDVVREISTACARRGLKFGMYLSPWDRNHADYGNERYITYYRSQLRELLGNYGPIFEVWFDGANGGDGYYGGARETRWIDKLHYYDWENTWSIVRAMQPDACMFSDAGPDIRWVGNERGIAGDPCWSTLTTDGLAPGHADPDLLNAGQREGASWLPAECDVSIRPGWFYHAEEDDQVKTPRELVDLYFHSVGRGASLLLNLPPDRRGRIHETDAASLKVFQQTLAGIFEHDLARTSVVSSPQPSQAGHAPACAIDGNPHTCWSPVGPGAPAELELHFPAPVTFNVISLREYLALGQRVDQFAVDAWQQGAWAPLAQARAIGNRRLLRLPHTQTSGVRLRVLSACAPCAVEEVSLYLEAEA
jgi:alpha-L-fucosidase